MFRAAQGVNKGPEGVARREPELAELMCVDALHRESRPVDISGSRAAPTARRRTHARTRARGKLRAREGHDPHKERLDSRRGTASGATSDLTIEGRDGGPDHPGRMVRYAAPDISPGMSSSRASSRQRASMEKGEVPIAFDHECRGNGGRAADDQRGRTGPARERRPPAHSAFRDGDTIVVDRGDAGVSVIKDLVVNGMPGSDH